jgi:hypothetical protein
MNTGMKRILFTGTFVAFNIIASNIMSAQTISITTLGVPYNQDFNTLTSTTGIGQAWTNGVTLSGWHLFRQPAPGTALAAYGGDNGGNNTGQFYSYGTTSERSFGAVASGGGYYGTPATGLIAGWMAVALTNNTGTTINDVTIGFNGEQWRDANATAQPMVLEYGFGTSFTTVGTWIAPGGSFNWSSIVNTGSNAAVNGNTTGLVTGVGGALSSLSWADGTNLWIRWVVRNQAGTDHALSIDNFVFNTSNPCTPPALSETYTDITCNGNNDGTIDLTTTGGTGPFNFSWTGPSSFSASTEDLSGLSAGVYSVTVTASGGCTASSTVTITEPSVISANITSYTDADCFGGSNGSATVTASGGTGTLQYLWSPSNGTTATEIHLNAGTYTVTVTDDNSCTASTSVVISEPGPIVLSATHIDATCNGGANGSIDLTASGGSPFYTFLWSNSSTSEDISGLISGTYTVTATDVNGCTATTTEFVGEATPIILSATHVDANCGGAANGSIDLTPTGGTGTYTYLWSNSLTSQDISGLAGGTYSVTVTDANGCTSTTSVFILQPSSIVLSTSVTNVLCHSGNTGSINLTATGGTGTLNFLWNTGTITEDISSLVAGTYTVTVTDANGCNSSTSAVVNEPASINAAVNITQPTCASAANGSIDLTVMGGATGYTFSWSNSATTEDISGLSNGTYTVTVTDANGCTATASATLNAASNLQLNLTWTNASCNGGNNGTMDLTVLTGSAPFIYAWSNGATTQDISGLSAGNYSVTVTDASGCSGSTGYQIGEPGLITSNISVTTCGSYTSPSGLYTWTSTGLYSDTLTSIHGCDSLIGIELTIPTPNTSVSVSGFTLMASLPGASYQWLDCNNGMNPISGATGQFYTSPVMGSFAVIVNVGGCFDTSSCYTTFNTALIPENLEATVTLYPNPNNGHFNVAVSGLISNDLYLEILDLTGKNVYKEFRIITTSDVLIPFQMEDMDAGIYVLRMFSGGKYRTWRFIKH